MIDLNALGVGAVSKPERRKLDLLQAVLGQSLTTECLPEGLTIGGQLALASRRYGK
jgi:hypothetical protein